MNDQVTEAAARARAVDGAVPLIDRLWWHEQIRPKREVPVPTSLDNHHLDQNLQRTNVELFHAFLQYIEVLTRGPNQQRVRQLVRDDCDLP